MRATSLRVFFNYTIYSLAILVAFLLVFEPYLKIPMIVKWLGHWHPIILHFPIVLIFVTIFQYWRKDQHIYWYLAITTLVSLLSVFTGLVLSLEGGSKGNLITIHQWLGIGVASFMVVWYFLSSKISSNQMKLLQGSLIIVIVLTGHFGGMVTHGEDFLTFGRKTGTEIGPMPDDPNIYTHIVQPIFDNKCVSCHNENKAKGELMLTDFASFAKGGESGKFGDDSENELLHRIKLSKDHEDHMPPSDEKQLSSTELSILESWFELGASSELTFAGLEPGTTLYEHVQEKIELSNSNKWADLPEVSDEDLAELRSDYCTIRRINNGINALQVLVFPHKTYNIQVIENLKSISKNIIELNLFDLPLTNEEIRILNSFENVELLNIRGCSISDEDFNQLKNLDKLEVLRAYDTQLSDEVIDRLASFISLRDLYLFNTKFTSSGLDKLMEKNKQLNIMIKADEADEFKAVLPPPVITPANYFFSNPFYVKFEHPLTQIDFRFTLDGNDPDEHSRIVSDSLLIDKNCKLKFFAFKEGWESSDIDSMMFMKSDNAPSRIFLEYPPNEKYAGRGAQLLVDLEKGPMDFGDSSWMAFLDNNLVLTCEFDEAFDLNGVVLSSMVHTDPYLFPPSQIRVYGGMDKDDLHLLGSVKPAILKERVERQFRYYDCGFKSEQVKIIKIVVEPLGKIPVWHQGKGERGWFFIDEVVIMSPNAI